MAISAEQFVQSQAREDLGTRTYTANGTASSDDFGPAEKVALHVVAKGDGTAQVFEVYPDGKLRSLGAAVAFTANMADGSEAEIHFVDQPVSRVRVVYVNTSNAPGSVSFRAVTGK